MKALRSTATEPAVTPTDEADSSKPVEEKKKPVPVSIKLESQWLKEISWRSIGPANMGGRITDIAIHGQDPSLWWIATASGGLLKTQNQGVTDRKSVA